MDRVFARLNLAHLDTGALKQMQEQMMKMLMQEGHFLRSVLFLFSLSLLKLREAVTVVSLFKVQVIALNYWRVKNNEEQSEVSSRIRGERKNKLKKSTVAQCFSRCVFRWDVDG